MKSHLSEEQISAWISGERDEAAAAHLRDCSMCMAEVESTARVLLRFRDSGFQVAEHWRQEPAALPAARFGEWAMASVVLTIALIAVVVLRHPVPAPLPLPEQPTQQVFMRIPYVVPPAPYERTEVLHMDVPVAALIAAGFRMDTAMAANSVPADVLVGQDGRPLAVSFQE